MKKFLLILLIAGLSTQQSKAQVNFSDSLALRQLYLETGGPSWTNQLN